MAARTQLLFQFRLGPVIAGLLARKGIDAAKLIRDASLPAEMLHGEVTAPLARIQSMVDAAATALGDPVFGLALAEAVPAGSYGVAEFLMRCAPTVEGSFRVLCDFGALINPASSFKLVIGPDGAGNMHYAVGSERQTIGRHLNEFTIAYMVKQFGQTLRAPVPLRSVWFSHNRTTATDVIEKHFGCPVRYNAADCGLSVAPEVLVKSPPAADELLHAFLRQQARAQLAASGQLDIVSHVVRTLEPRLAAGDVSANAVARAMSITPRSLQRHLADAGTTFREVLAHVRNRRRAELAGGGLDETTIARQLGFSDARAMRRSLDE